MASAFAWFLGIFCAVLLVARFGTFKMAGTGMLPTFENSERLIYEKRVEPERLKGGAIIAYRTSDKSSWGEAGWIVIARILAVPGDRLSIRNNTYVVNGKTGPAVADTDRYKLALSVPQEPETLVVPEGCYFVVQDSPTGGFDSQVLSWAETKEVVSTQIYYLGFDRGLMQPVN
jgi:signal peptidase I